MAAALPTGTVTFLFTDIEGSTKLLRQLGDDYARVLGEHQALLRAAWAAHGGVEIDTAGDGFFVAFANAPEAVAAAADATRALADHAWPAGPPLRIRIGLHTGTPQLAGDHYVGLDVHRTARIAAASHGGQVLLSQTTRDLAAQRLPAGATLRALGAHRLKDLQEPEPLYQLVLPGLPADFPPLKTLDRAQHNLLVQPTPLLGREREVRELTALVRRKEVRLVTFTGPGGIGKTRLAIQVAAELVEDFPDGVWFVRLSRLTDPMLVTPTIAQTLGLREAGSQPIAELLRTHVADKQLLLVLDNFEQVVGAAGEVSELLAGSPALKVLVTSRLPLHLRGEHEYALVPLPFPDTSHLPAPDELAQYAAVALFIERAQEAKPTFAVTAANAPAIAEICTRLDGLPLAIELVASRVKVLPPEVLLARLSTGLALLTGGPRDLEERQRTMRATIAWSEDLLTAEEQRLFLRLAVFTGGWTLDAAEAICAAPEGAEPLGIDMLEGMGILVDHSLIQQREEGSEPRFAMLQVIREYALERLGAVGPSSGYPPEAEALHRAHLTWCLALAERVEPWLIGGPRLREGLGLVEREHDNLRAALGWARTQGEVTLGLRLAGALSRFWFQRWQLSEGRQWLEELLALHEPARSAARKASARSAEDAVLQGIWAKALLGAGELATFQGDFSRAESHLEESITLAQEIGDVRLQVLAHTRLGAAAQGQGDLGRATTQYEKSMTLARQLGDPLLIVMPLENLGEAAYLQGDLARAKVLLKEAVEMDQRVDDLLWLADDLAWLADTWRRQGDLHQAFTLLREAFAVRQRLEEQPWPHEVESLAAAVGAVGQGEFAARLLGAAAALRKKSGAMLPAMQQADVEQAVASARQALGEERWAAAFAAGQALSPEEAVAEALGDVDEGERSST